MQRHSISDRDYWANRLDGAACFSDEDLAGRLEQLMEAPSIALQALAGPMLGELVDAASDLAFRPARTEVGKPERRVYQEFGYCGSVPEDHPLAYLGPWMERRVLRALSLMDDPPVPDTYTINDIVCQVYRPGDLGISPHRDHISYTGLIILIVLSGRGRYFVCADRRGNRKREIPAEPGWMILMPGPGFAGHRDRPFHMVGDISELRYSVGLRHDARRAGTRSSTKTG